MSFFFGGGCKDGVNWYGYAANNPLRFIDPSGLEVDYALGRREEYGFFTKYGQTIDAAYEEASKENTVNAKLNLFRIKVLYDSGVLERTEQMYFRDAGENPEKTGALIKAIILDVMLTGNVKDSTLEKFGIKDHFKGLLQMSAHLAQYRLTYGEVWMMDEARMEQERKAVGFFLAACVAAGTNYGYYNNSTTVPSDFNLVPKKHETFYRTMSQADYDTLVNTGKLPATRETFISPTKTFAKDYNGVTVRFTVRSGTTDSLLEVGVRDASKIVSKTYNSLPIAQKGWANSSAFFKGEGNQVNIGLGKGKALDIFNNNILNFLVVK